MSGELRSGPLAALFAGGGRDADQVAHGCAAWCRELGEGLGGHAPEGMAEGPAWVGTVDDPVQSVAMPAAALRALQLLCLYAEDSTVEWPDTVPPLVELDPLFAKGRENGFGKSRFGQVLAADLWLPGSFLYTVRFPRPDGADAEIGSLGIFLDQLFRLERETFAVGEGGLEAWLALPADDGCDFVDAARRGLAAACTAARSAHKDQRPLLLAR